MARTPPPDEVIVENLSAYRRRYGDARHDEEEERAPTDIIAAHFLAPELVQKRLLDLQEETNNGRLATFNCQGSFNPITQRYEVKKKIEHYTEDNPNRNNRFIFGRLRILIDTLLKHLNLDKGRVYLSITALSYKVQAGYRLCYSLAYPSRRAKKISAALVSTDLLRICSTLECTRDSLWISIRDPGWFCGDIMFKINDQCMHGLDRSPGGTIGQPIPSAGLGTMTNVIIANDITCLLIIENHALFSVLWQLNYHTRYKCIMVNLSGHPDLLVREFLCRISAADRTLPVFCLCDLDFGGYLIAKGLKFGTVNSAFMHVYSHCKSLQWMGIMPSDITAYDLQPDYNSDCLFTDSDRDKLRAHMAKFTHFSLRWKEELEKMIDLPRKVKLQGDGIVDKYLLCKLEDVSRWGEP